MNMALKVMGEPFMMYIPRLLEIFSLLKPYQRSKCKANSLICQKLKRIAILLKMGRYTRSKVKHQEKSKITRL